MGREVPFCSSYTEELEIITKKSDEERDLGMLISKDLKFSKCLLAKKIKLI